MYVSWKLTLILLILAPIIALGGYVEKRFLNSSENGVAFEEAGKVFNCFIRLF